VPTISDRWPGIETILTPGREILLADTSEGVLHLLRDFPESERRCVMAAARKRVLQQHTASHRAIELEQCYREVIGGRVTSAEIEEVSA